MQKKGGIRAINLSTHRPVTLDLVSASTRGKSSQTPKSKNVDSLAPHSPGSFFAAVELKTMLAHLVLNYDMKLENEGVRPPTLELALAIVPNIKAKVLFRKRKTHDWAKH